MAIVHCNRELDRAYRAVMIAAAEKAIEPAAHPLRGA
jgi:peroxiredoxin family protein